VGIRVNLPSNQKTGSVEWRKNLGKVQRFTEDHAGHEWCCVPLLKNRRTLGSFKAHSGGTGGGHRPEKEAKKTEPSKR